MTLQTNIVLAWRWLVWVETCRYKHNFCLIYCCVDWNLCNLIINTSSYGSWDSAVDIRTRYWPDVPGVESQWGARFSTPVQTGPGAHLASYTMGTRYFQTITRLGLRFDHPPQSSTNVKKVVEPYLYSPSGPLWLVLGWTVPLPVCMTWCQYV